MADKELDGDQIEETGVAVEDDDSGDDGENTQEQLKKVIDVAVEDIGTLRKRLVIKVPRDSIQSEQDSQYKELIADAVVPGFRRGRAPRRLVEKRFGREVSEQVQTKLVSNAYLAAIDREDIKVLGDPLVWASMPDKANPASGPTERLVDMPTALEHMKLPDEGDFEFKCEVEVKPEIELPSLEGIPVEKPSLKITDKDASEEIDRIRSRRGHFAPVVDGKVEDDDLLICDVKMSVGGEVVKTMDNLQLAARPQRVDGVTLEDFGKKFKGAKLGDSKSLEGALPDDYEREDLRGKKATFEFTLQDIKRLVLPPLDAAYLEQIGFDSEKEYRTWVKEQMEQRLEREISQLMRRQIADHLVKAVKLDLPQSLSSRQSERVVRRRMVELRRQGVPQAEIDKHADELRTSATQQTGNDLRLHFILEKIAESQNLEVTEEEINGQIASIARTYGRRFDRVRDELARDNGIESLYLQIRDEKCLDHLLKDAKVSEVKAKAEEASKPAATKKETSAAKTSKKKKASQPAATKKSKE